MRNFVRCRVKLKSLRKRSIDVSTNEPARKKARTDPGPSHAVSDSNSEKAIPVVKGGRTRIADDDDDDDNGDAADEPSECECEVNDGGNASPTQVAHGYINVTNRDGVRPRSNLTLEQKFTGPQIPRNFVTLIQFFMLFFDSTLVRK
jgi:hypothetical protein